MAGQGSKSDVLMYAVGDVAPSRKDPDSIFARVAPELNRADIGFCQLEINLTERGTRLPQARHTDRAPPAVAHALKRAGFNVVSWAGNHCMDWGRDGFFDTIDALKSAEIAVIGAGATIAEARQPAIVEKNGNRVAFLAYNTILPMSYWAEENRPGCAPMRAFTHYEQIEHDQPGTPCRIHTFANQADLAAMVNDIKKARTRADVVIMSIHWGIHFVPAVIADYQREVARAAVEAGADLILGHHAHILKGTEIINGVPVIYSLCNFAMDLPMTPEHAASKGFKEIQTLNPDWIPDFESTYNFPKDSRKTLVVKAIIGDGKLKRVSLLPTYVDRQSQPEILKASDPRFDDVVQYLDQITRDQNLNAAYVRDGDEILIEARA
jgi:poly-gamma-glutamate capsule biosynthesis protein CapA/YwtB (metallophosphatase superfamily)